LRNGGSRDKGLPKREFLIEKEASVRWRDVTDRSGLVFLPIKSFMLSDALKATLPAGNSPDDDGILKHSLRCPKYVYQWLCTSNTN
jgi:hypothetical protein